MAKRIWRSTCILWRRLWGHLTNRRRVGNDGSIRHLKISKVFKKVSLRITDVYLRDSERGGGSQHLGVKIRYHRIRIIWWGWANLNITLIYNKVFIRIIITYGMSGRHSVAGRHKPRIFPAKPVRGVRVRRSMWAKVRFFNRLFFLMWI